jgi:transposase
VVIVSGSGKIVADFQIEHTQGWQRWREQVAALGPGLAACVETSQGFVVEQLLESGVAVYPISTTSAKGYRQRKVPSGNKTDHVDAWSLADALRVDGHGWKALAKEDPLVAELRLLCRDEVALIEERTALINQLQSAGGLVSPAALVAVEDGALPRAWGVGEAFPTPQALASAGKRKWEKFLHTERLARPQTYEKRMEIFAHATGFVSGQALTRAKSRLALARVRMLRVLQSQIDSYRAEIEKLFAQHPDHDLFGSLPGAGPKIAPRLLGEIGSDRSRFEDPSALQCLAGTAPVSYQSGQIHKVYLWRHCNKLLRYAVHLWANLSRQSCPWAAVYYEQLRTRGKATPALTLPRSTLAKNPLKCGRLAPAMTRNPRPQPAWHGLGPKSKRLENNAMSITHEKPVETRELTAEILAITTVLKLQETCDG